MKLDILHNTLKLIINFQKYELFFKLERKKKKNIICINILQFKIYLLPLHPITNQFIYKGMKKLFYLVCIMGLIGTACNKTKAVDPETAFQACADAEKAYESQESDSLFEEAKKVYAAFFENYINTPYAQQVFSETKWTRRLNQEQLESVVNQVTDPAFKETEAYQNAANRLNAMKYTQPGYDYVNIVSKDPEGNAIELSEYVGKGKYVLLDFWASWCPDCRKEMPALVELYNTFKDRNFEIVGYSLDRKEEAWKKGIEDLNITWPQLSDCNYWESQGAKLYAVQWIPMTILINPEGKIIERGLSIDELLSKIDELTK
jgi:thiol-disulfide isomerase/thioredoxin